MSTGSLSSSSPELSLSLSKIGFSIVKLSSSPEGAEIVILIQTLGENHKQCCLDLSSLHQHRLLVPRYQEKKNNEPVDVNSPINTPDNNIEQIGVAGGGTEKEDDQDSTVSKSSNLVVGEEDTKEDEKDGQVDQPMVE